MRSNTKDTKKHYGHFVIFAYFATSRFNVFLSKLLTQANAAPLAFVIANRVKQSLSKEGIASPCLQ
jgi:hypothetical protein